MNPLFKKEIRLLLPVWIAALLLAIAPVWLLGSLGTQYYSSFTMVPDFCFAFGAILLGVASFGQEFSSGAFTLLLSQPVERRRFWLIKTVVLAGASISVVLAYLVSRGVHFQICDFAYYRVLYQDRHHALEQMSRFWRPLGWSTLYAVACFSGGLWATLLLRRMSEAFWATLLVPPAIVTGVGVLLGEFVTSPELIHAGTTLALALYSVAGFFWARRLFLCAQDVQWTGGEIVFPSRKKILQRRIISCHPRHWLTALVWKELQLHQVNVLIAGLVLMLDLASVIIRKLHPHFADPNVLGILELVWMLWLLMPLLIGSAAVAEEHRNGTFESQLCLPVSRRTQFFTKFSVALILSLFLGGVMPSVIERAHEFNDSIFLVAVAIFFVSFYASTVVRTTIQAIGLTILVATAIYFYAVATAVSVFKLGGGPYARIGLELLKLYLGVPILALVLAGLTYSNFKWLYSEGKLRRRNGIAVLATFAFIFACTNGIHFRVWEWLIPTKPHGSARLSESAQVKVAVVRFSIFHQLRRPLEPTAYVLLPDGRLWSETLLRRSGSDRWTKWYHTLEPGPSQFIGGTNWVAVAADDCQALSIRSNGTLWSIQMNPHERQKRLTEVHIGADTNWSQVAGGSRGFLLLKKGGTLWVWGTNACNWQDALISIPRKLKLDLATPPARINGQTNWAKLFSINSAWQEKVFAAKSDNGVWGLSVQWGSNLVSHATLQRANVSDSWRSFVSWYQSYSVGINTNGELWFVWYAEAHGKLNPVGKIQLGRNSKWRAAVFSYSDLDSIIALRDDGTLWKWQNCWALTRPPRSKLIKPLRLGNHSDWIALWPAEELALALSADGSLWVLDEPSRHIWLAPPRKPVYLGNIFKAKN